MTPVLAKPRDTDSPANVPPIKSAADAVSAVSALVAAVAVGEVTPSEAAELSKLIDGYVKSLEVSDLAERITELEMTIAHEPVAAQVISPVA